MLLIRSLVNIRQYFLYDDTILRFRNLVGPFKLYAYSLFVSMVVFVAEICYGVIGKMQLRRL